jgi:hypothetical protein
MQRCSDPIRQSSTVLGRSLLEWYCNFEDYCCFVGGLDPLLPRVWRDENVRSRQPFENFKYSQTLSRKNRILDDLWPQLWTILPDMLELRSSFPKLVASNEPERSVTGNAMLAKLSLLVARLNKFTSSPFVEEVFEQSNQATPSKHSTCCPPPPFKPYYMVYPPAGVLRIVQLSVHIYVHRLIRSPLGSLGFSSPDIDCQDNALQWGYDLSRTFAGIEAAFSDTPDALFPVFSSLTVTEIASRHEFRIWMRCKLAHFEQLGKYCFEPLKRHLAVLWGMPKLTTDGFSAYKYESAGEPERTVDLDTIDLAANIIKLNIHEADDAEEEPV